MSKRMVNKEMPFGERMRGRRQELGMTMAELGKKLGITAAAVSRYELGQRVPKMDMVARIAAALETEPYLLMDFDMATRAIEDDINRKFEFKEHAKEPPTPEEARKMLEDAAEKALQAVPSVAQLMEMVARLGELDDEGQREVLEFIEFKKTLAEKSKEGGGDAEKGDGKPTGGDNG